MGFYQRIYIKMRTSMLYLAALTAGAAAALSHPERDELAQMCVEIRAAVAAAEELRS